MLYICDMKETKIKSDDFAKDSKELKSKRQMMGVKASDFCKLVNMTQSNYSRVENGLLNPKSCMTTIRVMWNKFKKERIKALQNQIELLNEIV